MRKHPDVFPPLMINMVRAGETGGFLEGSLESIADELREGGQAPRHDQVGHDLSGHRAGHVDRRRRRMLIFIVPVFEKMFKGLGSELPLPTEILVVLSQAMVVDRPRSLVVVIIAFAIWWRKNKNTEEVRKRSSTRSSSRSRCSAPCSRRSPLRASPATSPT